MQVLSREDMWLFINSQDIEVHQSTIYFRNKIGVNDLKSLKFILWMCALKNRGLNIGIAETDSEVSITVASKAGNIVTETVKIPDDPMIRLLYKFAKFSESVEFYNSRVELELSGDAMDIFGEFFKQVFMLYEADTENEDMKKVLFDSALDKLFEHSVLQDNTENVQLCMLTDCKDLVTRRD